MQEKDVTQVVRYERGHGLSAGHIVGMNQFGQITRFALSLMTHPE
jgi:hypothetical protein